MMYGLLTGKFCDLYTRKKTPSDIEQIVSILSKGSLIREAFSSSEIEFKLRHYPLIVYLVLCTYTAGRYEASALTDIQLGAYKSTINLVFKQYARAPQVFGWQNIYNFFCTI